MNQSLHPCFSARVRYIDIESAQSNSRRTQTPDFLFPVFMKGLIQEHPLAELIREISLAGLSGALRLERERVKFVLYFEAGALSYAASNLRPHRLAECLKRWGAVPEAELAAIKEADNDAKLLAALSATARYDDAALREMVERQAAEVLRPALLLTDGVWFFDSRARPVEGVRAKIETSALAIESARRLPAEFVASRFPRTDEKLAPEPNFPSHLNLLPQEGFVLSRVDAQTSVRALIAISGLPEMETLRALYALTLGGFLLRDNWPTAFTAEEIERLRATAEAIEKGAPTQTVTHVGAQAEESVPVAPRVQAPKEELDQPRELEELFARMDVASSYYEVLGIVQRAELRDIKRAYHQLARRFHPDRFHQEQDRELHARIESAFARIAQAYETLRDRQLRASYDLKLKSPKSQAAAKDAKPQAANVKATKTDAKARIDSPAKAPQNSQAIFIQAEENFQQGIAAMRDGQRARAASLLAEAARLAPQQPNYRAYYGRALAASEETRHKAESEFQAAITLDANNASYHVMLAELYLELGFHKRAQSIAEHALRLDSRNVAARLLLDKTKQK
ncbi:MAG: DnaJ domain-containing protein [Pyrinomonadaceae bacterium]